jgi:glycosyltransferase involved in cell wall biosynthesis
MKKILYIEGNTDGTIGGSYYSLLYLIQGLDKTKYEPHVLFCQDNILIPEYKKITPYIYINNFGPSNNYPRRSLEYLIKWPYRFLDDVILKQLKLQKIIDKIRPDLVHINNGYAAMHEWVLACYLNKIKVIAHDRGTGYPSSLRTKLFVRFLDAIISVSNSYKENVIKQNLKVKRIRRVYNGLDIEKMMPQTDSFDSSKLKFEFKIKEDIPVVGIIGNITEWKGQMVVLQAINLIKHQYPNVKCLIVGPACKGSEIYKNELEKYVVDNNLGRNVFFTGFRKDVANILNIIDIFIHASTGPEPFSRAVLEAMATAKPIIATNSGGTPEQILDGITGKLVPMNEPEAMADAVIFYLSDMKRAKQFGENGRKRLTEMFSIKRMVKETENIYEELFSE